MMTTSKGHGVNRRATQVVVTLLSMAWLPSSAVAAECDDTIYDPGKAPVVSYHTNHWKLFQGCIRLGDDTDEFVPSRSGKDCAVSRVDGCSLHESSILFTERDKRLMKSACNEHDLCYSTYGTFKLTCDDQLGANLNAIKKKHQGGYVTDVIVAAVLLLGDHKSGQEWGKDHGCLLCDDTIIDPGNEPQVVYYTNRSSYTQGCVRNSDEKREDVPHILGMACASSQVDGCGMSKDIWDRFSERDQFLMRSACNEHDLCYATWGRIKEDCDQALKANLVEIGKKHQAYFSEDQPYKWVPASEQNYESRQQWGKDNNCRSRGPR